MDKYQKAIVRYETARNLSNEFMDEKIRLTSACEYSTLENDFKSCLIMAFDEMSKHNNGIPYDERFTYDDSLDCLVNDYNGACESCRKARKIKCGALAASNKELGIAKRQLSALAKGLMKNG